MTVIVVIIVTVLIKKTACFVCVTEKSEHLVLLCNYYSQK
jgi:hypothetical protein